jgi:uncharacterized protein (TIGR02453 family)
MAATGTVHFAPELFGFFKQLRRNNNRDWFQANKARYEEVVRDPALAFIADFAPRLKKISTQVRADARPSGGSLFRLHRDVRFSPDKSPYKTHTGIQFRHKEAKDVHAPGYYLHLEPGQVFAAAGIWHPDSAALVEIRRAILSDPKEWSRVISGREFRARCTLSGDSLKRPPRGIDPDHPLIEDLKRKDLIAVENFGERDVTGSGFIDRFESFCRATAPLQRFLTRALDLSW